MKIETAFSCGDKAWIFVDDHAFAKQVTIGQVRVSHTQSPGLDGEEFFDNYKPQSDRSEEYMCVETGVGSGRIYTLNKDIFESKQAAEAANAKRIAKANAEREARRNREKADRVSERDQLLLRLKRLDASIAADAAAEARSA